MLLHLKIIPKNPRGVADLIALGFNPGVKKMKISRFGRQDFNSIGSFQPKPVSDWYGVTI